MSHSALSHAVGSGQQSGRGETDAPALEVRGLGKSFPIGGLFSRQSVRALHGVDLTIGRGEIVALVGESGSGKSTLARCVARLEKPSEGAILLDGVDVLKRDRFQASRAFRSQLQMVFQDPFGSLNPAHRIGHFLQRSLAIHRKGGSGSDTQRRLEELMTTVGLQADMLDSYPHELSGGQRQRVAIARALAVEPQVILADEPTSMLDVSVRIGVLNLMRKLRDEQGISMLYITHDLASARYLADRTAVMFAGELVEEGESLDLLANPAHPYTQLLVSAVSDPARAGSYDPVRRAELRQAVMASNGCAFDGDPDQPCSAETPVRHQVDSPDNRHWVRCHLYRPRAGAGGHALATEPAPALPTKPGQPSSASKEKKMSA
ncbi:ATP-binding cassette domain-containing protein [Paenarthrobacter ureafaciens]|uniref:ATP-binding cassette domain-containing protein n=1 Tax=Paenarthrobacter ureafaciens TaxID=37931 RepID=UPI0014089F19|nr:ATP-binding cassette domain-containing protein [Paenarthrobacter ureafaciens]MCX8455440.1 ATP-binding cassette domain-containing protein [Paenarthrobacter ureafaciens]MCY0973685.1 ATP-binding cassette domain-containing protein [Paenarthrobacter ureafaciens]